MPKTGWQESGGNSWFTENQFFGFEHINIDEVVLGPIQKVLEFNQYWNISRLRSANGCIICKFSDEVLRREGVKVGFIGYVESGT